MSLSPGQQLLQYRIDVPIGQGGMGVVWRAHDTSLGRDVALKFLPEELTGDPERMARLEREARLLAALHHPRIAGIFGFHQANGARFLAMELVEGEDLSQRLSRGPVPVAEAIPLALQIAEALEHAHERGVIHRDLKPANIKLDGEGHAKVLDFGLAKAIEGDPTSSRSGALSHSPTITGGMTAANVLLGTAAYMSPEQARGQLADRRADIWSFGVVLHEMLTGRRLFEGETISDTLAAVLRSELDSIALPKDTPPRLRALLRRCLERDPKRRLRDIGEARIALDELVRGVPDASAPPAAVVAPARGLPLLPVAAAVVVVALGAFAIARMTASRRAEVPLRKFVVEVDTSSNAPRASVLSPDGRQIAVLAGDHIVLRDLTSFESRSFPVEPGAQGLLWSPDSRSLGYFSGSRVMRLSVADGQHQVLSDTREEFTGGTGGCWTDRGTIVFSRGDSLGILEVSERGGDPRVLMPIDSRTEADVHEPCELPGGRGIVFVSHTRTVGTSQLWLWSKGKRRLLLELPGQQLDLPRYSPTGHLLFHRSPNTAGVWAVPFSLQKLAVTGEPFLAAADASQPSVADDGTLCFRPAGGTRSAQIVWFEPDGGVTPVTGPLSPPSYSLALDPTGPRVVLAEVEGVKADLWIYDYARSTRTRFTFGPGSHEVPDWSPDGRRLAYVGFDDGCGTVDCLHVLAARSDGGGRPDTLASSASFPSFTPDGRHVLYTALLQAGAQWDLMRVPADGSGAPELLIRGNTRALAGRVSPDGSLLAYVSNESERYEVYLTRYPSLEGRWQVSSSGGQWPRWSPRGDRLYFSNGDEILQVEVGRGTSPALGNPTRAFRRPHMAAFRFGFDMMFALSPDGRRLITARTPDVERSVMKLAIVQNWASEFRDRRTK